MSRKFPPFLLTEAVFYVTMNLGCDNMICICIDLKSFYASVECVERGLDPLRTNLVVADSSKTEKTICLAVTPSLKSVGVPGRPRLFEVQQIMKNVNEKRRRFAKYGKFSGKSTDFSELEKERRDIFPNLSITSIPRGVRVTPVPPPPPKFLSFKVLLPK